MKIPKEINRGGPDIRGPWPIIDIVAKVLPNFKPPDRGGATIPVWGDFRDGGTVTASLRGLQPGGQFNRHFKLLAQNWAQNWAKF